MQYQSYVAIEDLFSVKKGYGIPYATVAKDVVQYSTGKCHHRIGRRVGGLSVRADRRLE